MRRIAWFGDLEALVRRLGELPRWQEEMGLTTLLPESSVTHTSGFRASKQLEALNPLADWRKRPGLADHRRAFGFGEEVFACVPAYPPLPLHFDLPDLRMLLETLVECGHEGTVVSALDFDDVARMRLVREILGT
jgi:hypothetical protein